ncbi:MAG: efflux RND transporter periplasmic adaptor subunit, partial [Oscillospiraceae bacterium]|nr:efflux RND transporter periplasmic adaptor subunit [Oscillospiraceae bacterium]
DPYDSYGGEPFIQVGSGEGYQIVSTLTELQLGSVKVGDTITVNMWSNGMTYKGTIVKISPYPTDKSMSYYGSGNVSNYQFIADLECEDELQTWDGGEIILDSASDGKEVLFALMSAYVGEEGGRNYVLKAGEDGRVYRQYVETGKVVYSGWYVEIISGLSLDDYIAFPYGKNAVEGAKADYDSGVEKW